jgi:hypothetical protein
VTNPCINNTLGLPVLSTPANFPRTSSPIDRGILEFAPEFARAFAPSKRSPPFAHHDILRAFCGICLAEGLAPDLAALFAGAVDQIGRSSDQVA